MKVKRLGKGTKIGIYALAIFVDIVHISTKLLPIIMPMIAPALIGAGAGAAVGGTVSGYLGSTAGWIAGAAAGSVGAFFASLASPVLAPTAFLFGIMLAFIIDLVLTLTINLVVFTVYKTHGVSFIESKKIARYALTLFIKVFPLTNFIPAWSLYILFLNRNVKQQVKKVEKEQKEKEIAQERIEQRRLLEEKRNLQSIATINAYRKNQIRPSANDNIQGVRMGEAVVA